MIDKINHQVFTLFKIGYLPASGTFGSIFTILLYYMIIPFVNIFSLVMILLIITLYSWIYLDKNLKNYKNNDPKEIVIDEFIGQMIPLTICGSNLLLILVSFVLFRFFDITKIYPASIFDQKIKGSLGIIGDDIIAGIYSLVIVYFLKINL